MPTLLLLLLKFNTLHLGENPPLCSALLSAFRI